MSSIRNIGNLPPEFNRTERNEKQSQIKRNGDSTVATPVQSGKNPSKTIDQVNLSDSAKTMLQRDAEVTRFVGEMPQVETISPEDRKEIEEKIDSNFYSSPEVISAVASKVADETVRPTRTITPTRMQQVIESIRSNEYDSDKVIDVIANQMLKDILK